MEKIKKGKENEGEKEEEAKTRCRHLFAHHSSKVFRNFLLLFSFHSLAAANMRQKQTYTCRKQVEEKN